MSATGRDAGLSAASATPLFKRVAGTRRMTPADPSGRIDGISHPSYDSPAMGLADLTRDSVLQAIEEFDRLGREPFLRTYRFGPARQYFLIHDGHQYDSKPIAGAAHQFAVPSVGPLRGSDFS